MLALGIITTASASEQADADSLDQPHVRRGGRGRQKRTESVAQLPTPQQAPEPHPQAESEYQIVLDGDHFYSDGSSKADEG